MSERFEPYEDSGFAFMNKFKKEDKHPDMTGTSNVDGVKYKTAYWKNKDKSGKVYLMVKYQREDEQKQQNDDKKQEFKKKKQDDDGDFPF